MHESVKAREIEKEIRLKAELKGISTIKKVVLRAGKASGESLDELTHILRDHMKIEKFEIIEEVVALKCTGCGLVISEQEETLQCPGCGGIENEIISGMGFGVLEVE